MNIHSLSNEELSQKIKELEERNQFLELILDTIPINIFTKDTQSRYSYTNKLCDAINGVERGELLGKSDFDRNTPEEIARAYYEDDKKIMQSKTGSRMLAPEACGKEMHYYEIIKEPLIEKNGNVSGVLGIVLNIDSALGVLKTTSETENSVAATQNVSSDLANILGKRYDAFIYLNEAQGYYNILQKRGILEKAKDFGTLEDYYEACKMYIHQDDLHFSKSLPKNIENTEEYRAEKGLYSIEVRFCDEEGNYRWKEVECFRMKNGDSTGFLMTIFDIDDAVKKRQKQNLKAINNDIIDILSTVVEFRSVESGDHIQRIKGFTKIMLQYVNEVYENVHYTPELIDVISSASAMHDIGKIAIPDGILLKPGKLTPEEFDEMKKHTTKGCDILVTMENLQDENYYKYCYDICRHHHERYDGRGYPDGLKGDEISLEAQIVSVADVYDALISKRVYKDAYSLGEAYDMILNGECGVFSPQLMECFKLARADMEAFSREQFGV